jgi:hypothetical protein
MGFAGLALCMFLLISYFLFGYGGGHCYFTCLIRRCSLFIYMGEPKDHKFTISRNFNKICVKIIK